MPLFLPGHRAVGFSFHDKSRWRFFPPRKLEAIFVTSASLAWVQRSKLSPSSFLA
jgi:hypothetical protein